MSHQKNNTFSKLLDYFAEDEEDEEEEEEEIMNFEEENKKYSNSKYKNLMFDKKEIQKDCNNSLNSKQNEIFTELYSNIENNEENLLKCEERKLPINDMKEEDFNKFKVISFRPTDINDENDNNNEFEDNMEDEKEKENKNEKIIEKVQTNNWLINSNNEDNNGNQSKKEIVYNKIIAGQCSFGNFNETSNRSTSINTDKLGEFQQSTFFQDNLDQEMYKPEYLINSKSFDELESNNAIEANNISNDKNTNSNIIDTKAYTFKHNEKDWLNKKEQIKKNVEELKKYMVKQKANQTKSKSKSKDKKNKVKNNIRKNDVNKGNNNTINNLNKRPIELVLYDDAAKKREKMENIEKNNLTEIQLNSTRTKINKKSYQIALEQDDKKIEKIINKYSNKRKQGLSIIEMALIFQDLKIFRKLLQNLNINKLALINNINEFKNAISVAIKEGEKRKNEELNFLEQTWNLLNPEQKSTIRKDIVEGFLKILYASIVNISNISNILKQYLQAALFGEGILDLNNKNKNDDKLKLKNYIKLFYKLKENMIAYKNINNYNEGKYEKLINEANKNLTFEPNIPNNEDYRTTISERKKNFNFNSLYNRFIQKEKNKQTNLNKLKQNKMKEELKELKQKPTVSKYKAGGFYPIDPNPQNIHDKLYKMGKNIQQKKQEKIYEKQREEEEKFQKERKNFKLNLNIKENRRRMAKSFDNKKKPKGFDEYITRNKKAILEKSRIREMMEKIPCGENYEKIKRRSITPFNITDMKKKKKGRKNIQNEEFFTLQIKIPNGQLRTLKIYLKNDPHKIADEFCKIYSIKESVKKKLVKNIIECQRAYLNNKKYQEMEEEEELEEGEKFDYNEISGF